MNELHRLLPLLPLAALAVAGGSCYNPDLGDTPWTCSTDLKVPECPEGYKCDRKVNICFRDVPASGSDAAAQPDGAGGKCTPDPTNCPDKNYEPNNDQKNAIPLGFGHSTGWAICQADDKDYFKINLAKDSPIKITLFFKKCGTAGALDMVFFGGSMTESSPKYQSFDDPNGRIIIAKAETTKTGEDTFYLKVFSPMNAGSNFYELEVSPK